MHIQNTRMQLNTLDKFPLLTLKRVTRTFPIYLQKAGQKKNGKYLMRANRTPTHTFYTAKLTEVLKTNKSKRKNRIKLEGGEKSNKLRC